MESQLNRWSVESTLANLFGSSFDAIRIDFSSDLDAFISDVQNTFTAAADLQFVSAASAAENQTPAWQLFERSADRAIGAITEMVASHSSNDGLVAAMAAVAPDDVIRVAVDLLIAAADTTSVTALWSLYFVSVDRAIEDAIRTNGDTFVRWCLREAMRLNPVAPFLTRITTEDFELAPRCVVPKGQLLLISTYAMGRGKIM